MGDVESKPAPLETKGAAPSSPSERSAGSNLVEKVWGTDYEKVGWGKSTAGWEKSLEAQVSEEKVSSESLGESRAWDGTERTKE